MDSDQTTPHRHIFARWWGFTLFVQTVSSWWWVSLLMRPAGREVTALLEISVGICGIFLFFLPKRQPLLALATCVQLLNLATQYPEVPNHRVFTGLLGLAILIFVTPWRTYSKQVDSQRWTEFCAVARYCLVALYGWSVFHKLNIDFLFSNYSCGTVYGTETLSFIGLPISSALAVALPWITLLSELTIPLLLMSRRFSWWGTILGFLFHTALVFHPTKHFIDFTCIIFAALIATLPKPSSEVPDLSRFAKFWIGIGMASVVTLQLLPIKFNRIDPSYFVLWIIFLFLCAWLAKLASTTRQAPGTVLLPRTAWGITIVLVAVFNGATPYLGIKNKSSWDMYANLRLEEGVSNHLLITHSLDWVGEFRELVAIESSNVSELNTLTRGGLKIARLELDRLARRAVNPRVVYRWKNLPWEISPENLSPDGYQASYLKRKLLWFRPMVAVGNPVPCMR